MKTLAQLIADLCPNGVPFKKLGEIAQIGTGSSNRQDADPNGDYPFFVRSKDIFKNKKYEFDEEAILIPGEGGVGDIFHYFKGKYALHQRTYRIHITKPFINTKFVYYYMYANFKLFIKMHAVNGTVASIRKPMIEDFEIPVPPIEVQEKIVEILDKFTALTVELQAELQERQRQYEYYRNRLLSFGGSDNIHSELIDTQTLTPPHYKFLKMSEICKSIKTGLNPRSFFRLNTPDASHYYVTIREIKDGRLSFSEKTDRINEYARQLCNNRSNLEIGDLLFSGTGTIGETFVIEESPNFWNIKEGVYAIKPKSDMVLTKFLRYILSAQYIRKEYLKLAEGGTVKSISMKKLLDFQIPIPSLAEQERIVGILDRFEALRSDLSAGLPAEIEARQKQYEYYRNRLLSFTRMAN